MRELLLMTDDIDMFDRININRYGEMLNLNAYFKCKTRISTEDLVSKPRLIDDTMGKIRDDTLNYFYAHKSTKVAGAPDEIWFLAGAYNQI